MRTLLTVWLHVVGVLVPAAERVRWRNEWHADIDDVQASGASAGELLSLALGIAGAAATFRFEGMTMDGWTKEVMHAVRGLVRRPAFTAIAVLTLGLGIGANTAIFSVVNGVVLEPLDYPDSEQLVFSRRRFRRWASPTSGSRRPSTCRSRRGCAPSGRSAPTHTFQASIGGDDQPERVNTGAVSWQLFQTLRVSPQIGRFFNEEEDQPGGPAVAVLSHELWQRSFGADPQIVGRAIDVNGTMTDVIGVMPEGFDVNESESELWLPLQLDWTNRNNFGSHYLFLVGRLFVGHDDRDGGDRARLLRAALPRRDPERSRLGRQSPRST